MTQQISIAVPTFHRNSDLTELMPLLLDQVSRVEAAGGWKARIVIVDNDPDGGAEQVVRCVEQATSSVIVYIHEPTPGLAAVRNAALDAAGGDQLIAFMDDDGRPCDEWLNQLIATWECTGAAAVAGRVVENYQSQAPPWIVAGEFFRRASMPTLTQVPVAATTNLLLDLDQVRSLKLRFDERFGLAGGEDTLFTRQLTDRGGRIVWCDESVVVDQVPTSRLNRNWVLARSRSHGNTRALVAQTIAPGGSASARARASFMSLGVARVVWGASRALYGVLRRDDVDNAKGLSTAHRGIGMVEGAIGRVVQEYRRPTR